MKNRRLWNAGIAALVVGCGGTESEATTGAGTTSTGDGGATSTPPPQIVHVVDTYGDPLADVPVVVNDPDGAVTDVTRTAAGGTVSVAVPAGGSVSVFQAKTTSLWVLTVVDPPPGAQVRFPTYPPQKKLATSAETTTYEVTFTEVPANAYYVWAGLDGDCGGNGTEPAVEPATVVSDLRCTDAPTHRMIAFAFDELDQALAWGETTVSKNPAGILEVTSSLEQTTISSTTVEVRGIPSGTTSVSMSSQAEDGWFLGRGTTLKPPLGSKPTATLTMANVSDVDRLVGASVEVKTDTAISSVFRYERFSAATHPANWSFEADSVAWVLVGPADDSVPEHPVFAWSTAGPDDADGIELGAQWGIGVGQLSHVVLLPPDHPTSWRMPDVPEELASFRPQASSVPKGVQVIYRDWETVDGFAAALEGLPVLRKAAGTHRGAQWLVTP